MQRYSLLKVLGHALRRNRDWGPAWRSPELKKTYDIRGDVDVICIGPTDWLVVSAADAGAARLLPVLEDAFQGIAGLPVVIHCLDPAGFECIVPLSFADYLLSWRADAAAEFEVDHR